MLRSLIYSERNIRNTPNILKTQLENPMSFTDQALQDLNSKLFKSSPEEIIRWALELQLNTIVTTNFGPHEAVILHHVHKLSANMPVICIDHGYNTDATYVFAEQLTKQLQLKVEYYTPKITRQRREVVLGGIPSIDDEDAHIAFTQEVKLEPFSRAFSEHKPEVWLTAIRQEQTDYRASLDILSVDAHTHCLKVAPFFYWSEAQMEEYLASHDLPLVKDYYDPTKVLAKRECGLHLSR